MAVCQALVPSTIGIPPSGTSTLRSRIDQYNGISSFLFRTASNNARGLSLVAFPLSDSTTIPGCTAPQSCLRNANLPYLVLSCADQGGDAVTATAPDSRCSTLKVFHSVKQSTGRIASVSAARAQPSAWSA